MQALDLQANYGLEHLPLKHAKTTTGFKEAPTSLQKNRFVLPSRVFTLP